MIFNKGFICHKKADVINTIGNKIISLNSIIDLILLQPVTKCHDLKNKYHPANNLIWRQHTEWLKKVKGPTKKFVKNLVGKKERGT